MAALIIPILVAFASSLISRMLLGEGLAFFTYTCITDQVFNAQQQMMGLFNNIPADLLGLMSILKIPQGLSVVMSAMGVVAFIKAAKVYLGRS
jgi:uncharacterized membrane protein